MNHTAWTRTPALQLHLTSLSEIELMHPIITQEIHPFSRDRFQNVRNFPDVIKLGSLDSICSSGEYHEVPVRHLPHKAF